MKHSKLTRIIRDLDMLSLEDLQQQATEPLEHLKDALMEKNPELPDYLPDAMTSLIKQIEDTHISLQKLIFDYKKAVREERHSQLKEMFDLSREVYTNSLNDTPEYLLQRKAESVTFANESNRDLFIARIGLYNSWKYPGLELRPANGEFTTYIKGCDPLYLLDTDEKMFSIVKTLWKEQYQTRLRYYVINELDSDPLKELPAGQIGFILSVDFFNFRTIEVLQIFLENFFTVLRPGGVAMFTYNNCNLPYAVRNVENKFCCYTPGNSVIEIAEKIGFELLAHFNELENVSWLELRKPGQLQSIRGGQTLGEIKKL